MTLTTDERWTLEARANKALEGTKYEDPERQRYECHGVSLAIVQSGEFKGARVARGFHPSITSQHSWVVIPGVDRNESLPLVYDHHAVIIDCTLWSYDEDYELVTVEENNLLDEWVPHGSGSIWTYGPPRKVEITDPRLAIDLDREGLSPEAVQFLDTFGPYDAYGWMRLFNSPMLGWPSQEIVAAAAANPMLRGFIPIDIVGMLTDLNPGGLYINAPHRGEQDTEEPA